MMRTGYARLTAALLAAVGLHALLLFWSASSFPKVVHNGMLSVDLSNDAVAPAISSHPRPHDIVQPVKPKAKSSVHLLRKRMRIIHSHARVQTKPTAVRPLRQEPSVAARSAHTSPSRQMLASRIKTIRSVVVQGGGPKQNTGTRDMHVHAVATNVSGHISSQARSLLLANIEYPRPARRRGWQGTGEFQLQIARKSVRKVKVLASTGYRQLDQAARRGLLMAGNVPLGDGIYKLPVEFHLQ